MRYLKALVPRVYECIVGRNGHFSLVILYGSRLITGDAFAALKAAIPGVSVDRF